VGDPLLVGCLNQLAQHVSELRTVADNRLTVEVGGFTLTSPRN
jgi:hypothetical protein